jgi:hypothetical protein
MNYLKNLFKKNIESKYNKNSNNKSVFMYNSDFSENIEYTPSRLHTKTKKTKIPETKYSFNENYQLVTKKYYFSPFQAKLKKQDNFAGIASTSTENTTNVSYESNYVFDKSNENKCIYEKYIDDKCIDDINDVKTLAQN